jgi:tetratricopeptide (TPR) repeat protein
MRRRLLSLALLTTLPFAGIAAAQDDEQPAKIEPATEAAADDAKSAEPVPAATFAFAESLEAAREAAKTKGKPLLVVAVPDWYESPDWARLDKSVAADTDSGRALAGFEGVVVKESRDREIHVRHRLRVQGYPLVVVLAADGSYLGHISGSPAEGDESAWVARLVAIPPRAEKIAALRSRLDTAPEDPALLFELGRLLAEVGETARADALFERMEAADPLGPAERIGEARYLRMRHRIIDLLQGKKFADVEPLCLHWRRRFSSHARITDVLLLQANARFLAGKADEARELWQALVDDHGESDAAKTAADALKRLAD